jgi:biotin transport system substrate-specific component
MTSAVIAQRVFRPTRTMAMVLVVMAAALTALSAQWRFHLPFTPVPITGQTLVVLLTGASLGWRLGATGQALYLAAGIAGAPVFSDGGSGWSVIVGPTGGYLLGFLAAAAVVGWMAERGHDRKFWTMVGAFAAGSVVIYSFGLVGLMSATGWGVSEAFARGVTPFLVGDLVKALAAGVLLPGAWRFLGSHD